MDLNYSIECLQKTLNHINLAFVSLPKFDKTINFKRLRDDMFQIHQDLKQKYIGSLNDNEYELLKLQKADDTVASLKMTSTCCILEEAQQTFKQRRLSHQIERVYKCSMENCDKSYGSEVSLSYHLKMKHGLTYRRRKPTS